MQAKEFNIYGHSFTPGTKLPSDISRDTHYVKTINFVEDLEENLNSFKTKYPMNQDDHRVCNRITNQFLKELVAYKLEFLQAAIELDYSKFLEYTFLFLEELHALFLKYNDKYLFKFSFYDLYWFHYKHIHNYPFSDIRTYVFDEEFYNFLRNKYFGEDHA